MLTALRKIEFTMIIPLLPRRPSSCGPPPNTDAIWKAIISSGSRECFTSRHLPAAYRAARGLLQIIETQGVPGSPLFPKKEEEGCWTWTPFSGGFFH